MRRVMLIALVCSLQGCYTIHRSYVDTQYRHATYADIQRVSPPYCFAIKTEFQLNGKRKDRASENLTDHVNRSLRASGVLVPFDGTQHADGELAVVVNDVGSMSEAVAKGFATGLTWGLVGSKISDHYVVSITLTTPKTTINKVYEHAIISTIGLHAAPPGLQPISAASAGNQVTDDVTLNFLKDMQSAGYLLPRH